MPKKIGQKQLVQIFKDVKEMGTQEPRFCFLIGAGASKSSNIPTGWELANEWYQELKDILEPSDLEQWQDETQFIEERLGEFYPQLYEKRFGSNPKVGYEKFKKIMEGKEPDLGYVILSQILAKELHNFVITTNFDYLIEDAIRQFTEKKPFVAGHETLAGFVSSQRDRPTIVKVHRDLFLNPINDTEGTDRLKEEWKETLRPILKDYNLLVVGYGGNDGSLMDYLTEIGEQNREAIYWCKRDGDKLNDKITKLLGENDFEVSIAGFDELMFLLYGALGYDTFKNLGNKEHPFVQNALETNVRLDNRRAELMESLKAKKERGVKETDPLEHLIDEEWDYIMMASKEANLDKKEKIFKTGIDKLDDADRLMGTYALFLKNERNDIENAEKYYRKAIEANPKNDKNLGNYAIFLSDKQNDLDQAEKYYLKAIEANPKNDINLSNYALFLDGKRNNVDQAEKYYQRALALNPENNIGLANYALLLDNNRNDLDQTEKYYRKAIDVNPKNDKNLGNYALFLSNKRNDPDQAEKYYLKAIEANPENDINITNYAIFLENNRNDPDQAEKYYQKANAIKSGKE